jgi:hypothetical protein
MVSATTATICKDHEADMATVKNTTLLRNTSPEVDSGEPIYVTQPYLPPLEEFIPYLAKIWETKQLTNGGPFHRQLERALSEFLGVEHIALFTNGTVALVTALQACLRRHRP